jgi:hypothetical protein
MRSGSPLDQPNTDRLRSLAALDHIDRDPLAFSQLADASAVQSRCTHKNVLAAAVANDEAEPFVGGIELDGAGLLDHGLIGALIRPLGPGTPWRFVKRGAGIDTEEFGDLLALLPGPTRTSSVAPGGTALLPLRSTTLTCGKASPPVGSCTKPKPFSG